MFRNLIQSIASIAKIRSSSGSVTINGKTYESKNGDVTIYSNGEVVIDGEKVDTIAQREVHVTVEGDAKSVETMSGDVAVNGSVTNVSTMSGDVYASSITGKVSTMSGDIKV